MPLASVTALRKSLEIALSALEDITDPARSSMRKRDSNCVRYVASDALSLVARETGVPVGGIHWERYEKRSGDIGGEPHSR